MSSTIDNGAARPLGDDVAIRVIDVAKRYYSVDGGPTRNPALNDLILLLRQIVGFGTKGATFEALKDLSFDVRRGTALGIIGGNGSGKSTLLKLISRVTPPTAGRIEVNGRVVSLIEMGFGFRDDRSGRENVLMSGSAYSIPRGVMRERLDEIIEFAGVEKFIDMPLRSYSSGMYLRLAFATAIYMNPDIILADEVLAVGDIRFRKRCIDRLLELKDAGKTLLYVSHDLAEIRRIADQVLWLQDGTVAGYGDTDDVVDSYLATMDPSATPPPPLVTWDSKADGSPPATIESACLRSSKGAQVQLVESRRPHLIELRIRTFEPDLEIFPRIDISAGGEPLGRFAPKDAKLVRRPTTIEAILSLPRYVFNAGRYTARISIEIVHEGRRNLLVLDEPIAFSVVESHNADQPRLLKEPAPGPMHPHFLNSLCEWAFSGKVDSPDAAQDESAPRTTVRQPYEQPLSQAAGD